MPINANHEYMSAEKEYLNSKSLQDKIYWLEEMIKKAPKHKGSENLLKELRVRLKKFREKAEKGRKAGGGKKGIRKEGFQFVLVGKTNSGKSSLLNALTNANSRVGEYQFTTKSAEIGTFGFEGVSAQVIDIPSVGSENFDVGLVNNADCLLIVIEDLKDILDVEKYLIRARGRRIVVVSKVDKFDEDEKRKLIARLKSKKIDGVIVSALSGEDLENLKLRMFLVMGVIRVYMKEPGKVEQRERPMVLKEGSTVRDVAEHVLKGFSKSVKETRISGPSSKFANQRVGLNHELKDRDVVEFHTR
jgi:uncharacterized protein